MIYRIFKTVDEIIDFLKTSEGYNVYREVKSITYNSKEDNYYLFYVNKYYNYYFEEDYEEE